MKRDRQQAIDDKFNAVEKAEAQGHVADSLDVRMKLIQRIKSGEITLEQAKEELAEIKRNASREGKTTREQIWRKS